MNTAAPTNPIVNDSKAKGRRILAACTAPQMEALRREEKRGLVVVSWQQRNEGQPGGIIRMHSVHHNNLILFINETGLGKYTTLEEINTNGTQIQI